MFEPGGSDPKQRMRLLLAVGLSALILLCFDIASVRFTGRHVMGGMSAAEQQAEAKVEAQKVATATAAEQAALAVAAQPGIMLPLENGRIKAGVDVRGGRLDSLILKQYKGEITEPEGFALLKPAGEFAEYVAGGWMGAVQGPDENTVWQAEGDVNAPGKPVVLVWRNATGQAFQREVSLGDGYVMNVTERVVNGAELPVTLTPYVQVHRADGYWPGERSNWVNYFGPMGVVRQGDGYLQFENKYADLKKRGNGDTVTGNGGWWGVTNQYFMTAVMPGQVNGVDTPSQRQFRHASLMGLDGTAHDVYSASVSWPGVTVPAGGSATVTYQVYAGPKHYGVLKQLDSGLERGISWGWFEPLVKGLYAVLVWLHGYVNNWGLAVMACTLLLKIVTFPLANKSYHAMAKMKKLQPRVDALKERFKDNQQGMAMEMMNLYKKEKVNPLSGCWPMFIQIPIFFAMYKVVLVMFEFRHAPLGLWINDMSVHDPYFVLPVLMGISMFIQFKLNPKPADSTQALMFKWMPVLFTFMFLWFPAGLVLYWVTNNVLSIGQQYLIMKRDKAL